MTIHSGPQDRNSGINRTLRGVVCRVAALALFAMGLVYWTRLIGVFDGDAWRFDTMPVWWRIVAPALAVLYPVAGVGLWLLASWGTVIWTLVFTIECIMHLGFARLFGQDPLSIGLHALGLMILLILRVMAFFEQRKT